MTDKFEVGALLFGTTALLLTLCREKKALKAGGLPSSRTPSFSGLDLDREPMPHNHELKMSERMQENFLEEAAVERDKVVVRVPATTANMGPGYDTLGMAVDMWSEFTIERANKFEVICIGEGASDMPVDDTNLVCFGLKAAFKVAKKPVPTLKYTLVNRIPYARGLGSSSAAIVGGLIAGLVLAGHRVPIWGSEELVNLACEIEGHPDNVAPALYGGIQIGMHAQGRWVTERVNIPPGLQLVSFIPNAIGKTSTARNVLSDNISRSEAVFNIGRTAFLINALASNNIDNLRWGTEDMLHQPQRGAAVYPHMSPCIEAALEAGASAAYLSGAGPTIMAITSGASGDIFTQRAKERVDTKVAEAMLKAAEKCNVPGNVYISGPVEGGAVVVSADPPFTKGLVRYKEGL